AIAFKLADMKTEVEAAKLLVYRAADYIQKEIPCIKEVSMAKLFAARAARKISIEAVQVFGGYGYTEDYPVERYFRDAKVTEITFNRIIFCVTISTKNLHSRLSC